MRSNHHSQTGSRRERLPLKTTQQVNTHQQNTQTQTQFVSQTHNYHSKPQNRLTTNKGQQTHKGQKNTQLSRKLFLEKHCFYIKSQKVANLKNIKIEILSLEVEGKSTEESIRSRVCGN